MSLTPPPWSGRPPRLTEQERRALHEIEAGLTRSDPQLGNRLRRPARPRTQSTLDHVVQVLVVAFLCLLVLPGAWAMTLIALGGLCAMAVLGVRTFARTRAGDDD